MNQSLKRFLQISISILAAFVFLYIAFRNQNLAEIWNEITKVHIGWVLLFIPVSLTSHFVRAWRWKYFLTPVKPDIRLHHLFYSVMIGYFFNSILPRAGEFARPYSIKKLEDVPLSTAIGTVIVERVIDMFTLVVVFMISLISYREQLRNAFPWMESGSIILFVGCCFFLVFMLFLTLRTTPTIEWIAKLSRWVPKKIIEKITGVLRTFIDGFLVIHNREKYISIVLLSFVMWFLYTLQFYVVFLGFESTALLTIDDAMVLMVIASIGILIPMPGGTGTFHLFCSQGLVQLFQTPLEQALSYATVTHGIGLIFLLAFGAVILVLANFKISDTKSSLLNQPTKTSVF